MNRLLHFLLIAWLVTSCTTDSYEKGEGKYSLMQGDFVEAKVNAQRQMVSFSTDDGAQFELTEPYTAEWIKTPDTLYRCMLYYNKVDSKKAEIVSIGEVPCPRILKLAELKKEFRTDPVKFESMWLSKSGKYLNLYLQLKTGVTDDTTAVQQLAFISDTLIVNPDQTTIRHITLHHDQNKVPEYYSTKAYVSLLTDSIAADSIRISINTYTGLVSKKMPIR
ncbi:MAG: hypothetical protein IJQ60_06205 [Prevotella sp.]|nr:hypothetical protein [Prevotella sp.]MBR0263458.1 hypothetical protein [Prevotella sp.]